MAKRRRKCGDLHNSVDRISMLPDDLLVLILSKLTYSEARATTLLSSRWRYLWTFIAKLDFDGSELLSGLQFGEGDNELDEERSKYIRCVNQGIALHKKSTSNVEEFRVVFDLSKSVKKCIYKWLRFALSRKVQRLELDFTPNCFRDQNDCFSFPYKRLDKRLRKERKKVSNTPQSCCVSQHNSIDFKCLKNISMYYVNVDGEALEFLLRNCPVLEDLCVFSSYHLSSVSIIRPFPAFKRLEISSCDNLESLEIRDANLVYLKYMGSEIHFLLDNVPMLVEVFVGESITCHIENVLSMLSSYLPQLEILTIDAEDSFPDRFLDISSWEETAVKMNNLKQLTVKIHAGDECLLPMTNLIRASPYLERFVLEAKRPPITEVGVKREFENTAWSYSHFKELELFGYRGVKTELELVKHFVDNAVTLEKILVKLDNPPYIQFGQSLEDNMARTKQNMARRALKKQQLTKILPPRINLNIM